MTAHDIEIIDNRRLELKRLETWAKQYGILWHKGIAPFGEAAILSIALSRMWYGRAIQGQTRLVSGDLAVLPLEPNAIKGISQIKERLKVLIETPIDLDVDADSQCVRSLDRASFYMEESKMLFGAVIGAWKDRKDYAVKQKRNNANA